MMVLADIRHIFWIVGFPSELKTNKKYFTIGPKQNNIYNVSITSSFLSEIYTYLFHFLFLIFILFWHTAFNERNYCFMVY